MSHPDPDPDEIRAAAQILGRYGAHLSWSRTRDRAARTAPARAARDAKREQKIRDEHPDWSDAEVLAAAESLRKAEYTRMALAGVAARRAKAGR